MSNSTNLCKASCFVLLTRSGTCNVAEHMSALIRAQPVCLSRTLCYHREAARTPGSVRGHTGSLRLELCDLGRTSLSVVVALCHKTEAGVRAL